MTQPAVPRIHLPGASKFHMPTPIIDVALNPAIFEQFINSQGVRMVHSRPVPCPFVRTISDTDHNPGCNHCYNGFIYYHPTEFIGALMGNSLDRQGWDKWDLGY